MYWPGLLSQDYQPNALYVEAKTIGADLKRLGRKLVDLKKRNQIAIYVSNTALSAFNSFKIGTPGGEIGDQSWGHGRRAWIACSRASRTKPAVAEVLTFQPTIRRAKASITKAT